MAPLTESSFPDILCRSLYTDREKPWRFELVQDLTVKLSNGAIIVIPAGYRTDFASVPRLLKGVVNGIGNHNLAVLIHDYLYDTRYGSRKFADREMLHWLKKAECSKIKCYAMYYAVRLGGRKWWAN